MTTMASLLLLLACHIGMTSAQVHGHGTQMAVNCHQCGPFPHCLLTVKACHADEVCQFTYGSIHGTHIDCHKMAGCLHEVSSSGQRCSSGGALVHGQCQVCCTDDSCVADTLHAIEAASTTNVLAVHCPSTCDSTDINGCISTGHVCNSDEYCKMEEITPEGRIQSHCALLPELQACELEKSTAPCSLFHSRCSIGCCKDDACVASVLKNQTIAALNANLTAGQQPTGWWDILNGICADSLLASQCSALDTTQHLCGDRLALRLCPKTCGFCSLFGTHHCVDTVTSVTGCAGLVASDDICNSNPALAEAICPVTCKMCDQILDNLIHQALSGIPTQGAVTTHTPAPTSASSAVTTHTPAPTSASTAAPHTTLGSIIVTTTVAPHTNQGPIIIASTAAPSSTCSDTIQQMTCADVPDVCTSPLLVNYCQAFCGLCR